MAEKGFLTSFTKSGAKYYSAIDPDMLVDKCKINAVNAQNLLRDMEKILPILEGLTGEQGGVKVQYFDGFDGVKSMFEDVIKENKAVYGALAIDQVCPEFFDFIKNDYIPRRAQNLNEKSKIIIIENLKSIDYLKNSFSTNQMEYVTVNTKIFDLKSDIQIYGNKIGFYVLNNKNNLHGILITSDLISNTFRSLFINYFNLLKKC